MTDRDPCIACPWRTTNHGKRHPDGWYTKANLRRLWAGMRRGEHMTCHPTDPKNPISPRAQTEGYKEPPSDADTKQCMGATILQQREYMVLQENYRGSVAAYRRARPRGLTKIGIMVTVQDFLFGGTIMGGDGEQARPDLNFDVSAPDLDWPLGKGR